VRLVLRADRGRYFSIPQAVAPRSACALTHHNPAPNRGPTWLGPHTPLKNTRRGTPSAGPMHELRVFRDILVYHFLYFVMH
jgi:hypothetical protein